MNTTPGLKEKYKWDVWQTKEDTSVGLNSAEQRESLARNGGGRLNWANTGKCCVFNVLWISGHLFIANLLCINRPSALFSIQRLLASPMLLRFSGRVWTWGRICCSCLWFCCSAAAAARRYHLIANHMMNARKAVGKAFRPTGKWCAPTWSSIRCYPRTPSPTGPSHCEYTGDAFCIHFTRLKRTTKLWIFKVYFQVLTVIVQCRTGTCFLWYWCLSLT